MSAANGNRLHSFVRCCVAFLTGHVYACCNWQPRFGAQSDYYDGWHAVLHCGLFSVEVHW